jgi:hypothetical protein
MSAALVSAWVVRVWLVCSSLGKDRSTEGVNVPCTQGRISTERQRLGPVCCVPRCVNFSCQCGSHCPKDTPLTIPSGFPLSTCGAGLALTDDCSEQIKIYQQSLENILTYVPLWILATSCSLPAMDIQHIQMMLRYLCIPGDAQLYCNFRCPPSFVLSPHDC